MRLGAALLLASVLATSCREKTRTIQFDIPNRYNELVQTVTLDVLAPPRLEQFTCDDLAFDNVDASVIELSVIEQARGAPGEVETLGDLDREGVRLLLARGLDANGRVVLSACTAIDSLSAVDVVPLEPEPIPFIQVTRRFALSSLDPSTSPEVDILVTDAAGEPLEDTSVRFQTISGGGLLGPVGEMLTGVGGGAIIRAERPARPGPYILEIALRWAEPVLVEGVVMPSADIVTVPPELGAVVQSRFGRVGPNGEPGLVALSRDGADGARVVTVYYDAASGGFVQLASDALPGVLPLLVGGDLPDHAFGFLDDREGRERTLLISQRAQTWAELSADGLALQTKNFAPPTFGVAGFRVSGLFAAGSCRGGPAALMLAYSNGSFEFYGDDGSGPGELLSFGSGDANPGEGFVASGCLSDSEGSVRRTYVYFPGVLSLFLLAEDEVETFLGGTWLAIPDGLRFSPPLEGGRRLLIGTQVSLDDIVIARGGLGFGTRLDQDGNSVRFITVEPESVDVAPGFPESSAAGDLDGDGLLDLAAYVQLEENRYGIHFILGTSHRDTRLAGTVDLGPTGPRLIDARDYDGDGSADVLVVDVDPAGGEAIRAELYRMGSPMVTR